MLRGHLKIYMDQFKTQRAVNQANVFSCLHPGYAIWYTRLHTPRTVVWRFCFCVQVMREIPAKNPRLDS